MHGLCSKSLVRVINWISQYINKSIKSNQLDIIFNKCGIAMASNGNIYRGIQLIIDVIDSEMLKGKLSGRYVIRTPCEIT